MSRPTRIVISGADLLLPDRVLAAATLLVEDGRIADILDGERPWPSDHLVVQARGHYLAPGFVDVHVHGALGHDSLGGPSAVAAIARVLPRFGVTAFCPTTVACRPSELEVVLDATRLARQHGESTAARVLPAHLESNFINADYAGAQPRECLCLPPGARRGEAGAAEYVSGADIVEVIDRFQPDVGIVTLAPELPGALDLVRWLTARGIRVSLGHSGATYEEAMRAIEAGARGATHLYNRMPPLHHRAPGLVGAVLASDQVAAEIVCDGFHVHPALVKATIAAKGLTRTVAITDGTAGSGLPRGARATLGGRALIVGEHACYLDDGTLAGSSATMDGVFRMLMHGAGLAPFHAAQLCATTPARELGMQGFGVIGRGAVADLVVLDRFFQVVKTYVNGRLIYARDERES